VFVERVAPRKEDPHRVEPMNAHDSLSPRGGSETEDPNQKSLTTVIFNTFGSPIAVLIAGTVKNIQRIV